MKTIQNNPYRLLGVYANSPIKERIANHNKLKVFLKVGKQISFPLDLPQYFPVLTRTQECIDIAEAQLTLPKDQLAFAQFWFLKQTPLDDVAFRHLTAGDMNGAINIWNKKDSTSSLQNRLICELLKTNYQQAISLAETLYEGYSEDFITQVLGTSNQTMAETLLIDFTDKLCQEVKIEDILPYIKNVRLKDHLENAAIDPLIDKIQSMIKDASERRNRSTADSLTAGTILMNKAIPLLQQLGQMLVPSDVKYQMIADKLGLEILQCGIDYYNKSDDLDAAEKAMTLQKRATGITCGSLVKSRCQENQNTLQKIIDELPPTFVRAEDHAIKLELHKYSQLPDKISYAVRLLNNTKPHLLSLKQKLGITNDYYLKLSTIVVGNALHNIIEEVNNAQKNTVGSNERNMALAFSGLSSLKSVLEEAWKATKLMDSFDMETSFKVNRYNENRSILKGLCDQVGVSTSDLCLNPLSLSTISSLRQSTARQITANRSTPQVHTSSSNSNLSPGCIITIIILLIIIIIIISKGN
jgi:hypothetical protein